jgi:protease-4
VRLPSASPTGRRPGPSATYAAFAGRVSAAILAAALLACGRPAPPPRGEPPREGSELRELVLASAPSEGGSTALFEASGPTLRDVLDALDDVRTEPEARGVFLRVGALGGAFGRMGDLREALRAVRAARKPVHCHFDATDNAGYALLADTCDRISMTPAGDLELVGVAAHLFHARALLASLGVSAELLQMGRFKGAAEPFTRDAMSPETRESMGAVLDDLQGALVSAVARGRHLEPAAVQAAIDAGPHDAASALAARLVDAVAFDDEARERARQAAGAARVKTVSLRPPAEPLDLDALLAAFSGEKPERADADEPQLALVHLRGEISDGDAPGRGSGAAGPFVRELRRLADADAVKAVVLRIDSPGGSALASDRMWHAVRRVASRKPVIVSVGDMAASGGYYVACAATEVLAHDTSLVGSIGVVGGKVSLAGLAERVGVHAEVLARGTHAGWSSPATPFSDSERHVVERMLASTYARFLSRVSAGRRLDATRVAAAAEGRLWSGRRARELGLVDRAGGLTDALRAARERGHLPDDAPITVWPRERALVDWVADTLGRSDAHAAPGATWRAALDDASWLRAVPHAGPALSRLAALAPLAIGDEHVVVALPFAVDLR